MPGEDFEKLLAVVDERIKEEEIDVVGEDDHEKAQYPILDSASFDENQATALGLLAQFCLTLDLPSSSLPLSSDDGSISSASASSSSPPPSALFSERVLRTRRSSFLAAQTKVASAATHKAHCKKDTHRVIAHFPLSPRVKA